MPKKNAAVIALYVPPDVHHELGRFKALHERWIDFAKRAEDALAAMGACYEQAEASRALTIALNSRRGLAAAIRSCFEGWKRRAPWATVERLRSAVDALERHDTKCEAELARRLGLPSKIIRLRPRGGDHAS